MVLLHEGVIRILEPYDRMKFESLHMNNKKIKLFFYYGVLCHLVA